MNSFFFGGFMEKKKLILDLDRTIITSGDYKLQNEFFRNLYGESEQVNRFIQNIGHYLDHYEYMFKNYTIEDLSHYLTTVTGLTVTKKIISDWLDLRWYETDYLEPGIIELLEYVKSKDIRIVVLTNWFLKCQKDRLAHKDLLKYFDDVIGGEMCLKPHREAYDMACGNFSRADCLVVGDNLYKDYLGPLIAGYDAVLYDRHDQEKGYVVKVKKIDEIKNML